MSDNTPLSTEERQAIAERAARIAGMSTEDDCEYVESVLQLADSDIPRLLAHIKVLEVALEQRWNQWQTAEGRAEAAAKRIEALERRIEALEGKLRFYGDEKNYNYELIAVRHGDEDWEQIEYNAILEDRGKRARRALEVLK